MGARGVRDLRRVSCKAMRPIASFILLCTRQPIREIPMSACGEDSRERGKELTYLSFSRGVSYSCLVPNEKTARARRMSVMFDTLSDWLHD